MNFIRFFRPYVGATFTYRWKEYGHITLCSIQRWSRAMLCLIVLWQHSLCLIVVLWSKLNVVNVERPQRQRTALDTPFWSYPFHWTKARIQGKFPSLIDYDGLQMTSQICNVSESVRLRNIEPNAGTATCVLALHISWAFNLDPYLSCVYIV